MPAGERALCLSLYALEVVQEFAEPPPDFSVPVDRAGFSPYDASTFGAILRDERIAAATFVPPQLGADAFARFVYTPVDVDGILIWPAFFGA